MRLRSARGGAEHCACQWLRVPCDDVVKKRVVPWTWSLLYVPMKWRAFYRPAHPKARCARRGRVSPHAQRRGTRGPVRLEVPDIGRGVVGAAVGQKSGESDNEVMAANKDRVLDSLRATFFDNAAALECQPAAISLTLRGVNIVRALVTVGPGGVGQSLNSCLIANLSGGNHGFKDMNVFYTEDELRKQADTFTGKVNVLDESHVHNLGHENSRCPVFFCPIGPTVCSSRDRHRPGGPQHRQTAQRRPSQEGGERGPGGPPVSRTPS